MLTRPPGGELTIFWGDRPIMARPGDSVAAALLAAGVTTTRTTALSGAARGPYCMMGACFDCVAEVDGRGNVQTCMTPVRDGMRVRVQDGARGLGGLECDRRRLSPVGAASSDVNRPLKQRS